MTMLSFRVEESAARAVQAWAEALGIEKSELLREALRRHLLQLAAERDAQTWQRSPLTAEEHALTAMEEWAPAEDWSDWADAAG
jgi:Ribbon-helix-helix protein, copG family